MISPPYELCGLQPHARQHAGVVVQQRLLADHTFVIRVDAPGLARQIVPGQFFMIRGDAGSDPVLGRPFALYDVILDEQGRPAAFEFAYHVIGKMTRLMSEWSPGERVSIWGPLGNGFPVFQGRHLLCVGGGIGYTPFLAVARETLRLRRYGEQPQRYAALDSAPAGPAPRVSFCYGVQSRKFRADLADFGPLAELKLHLTTDDGSEGRRGFVTAVVDELLALSGEDRPDGIYCCGPEPMMHAVARLCRAADVRCWLSLETPMACGFGACFSCVTRVRDDEAPDGWDYRRTCVEGPIFPAESLALPE